jgi:hypothetical protein
VNLLTAEVTISPALAHYPPGASYRPRTLTDFELVWLRTGSAQWQAGECANLRLAPGDLLLIPPGTRDEFRWDREAPTRHGYVHFRSDPAPSACRSCIEGRRTARSAACLSRVFRKQYGCGPSAALELVRLERASTMLTRSNLSIGQVANACGFADPLYFSRRFRAVHGIPPSAYRHHGAAAEPPFLPGLPGLARRLAPQ